jgi:hypothetical protein
MSTDQDGNWFSEISSAADNFYADDPEEMVNVQKEKPELSTGDQKSK